MNDSSNLSSSDDDPEEVRKSKIRDTNKEYAKRMTILQSWSNFWNDYTTRQGDAYPPLKAREILRKTKKIKCPIESCNKVFTTYGGLKYHYARCKIERCFKCNVCDPPLEVTTKGELLKHMILGHYNVLPELDEKQKEIANSFLCGEQRADKYRRDRISTDYEPAYNPTKLLKAFKDLQDRVFKSDTFNDRPYKNWRCNLSDWELLTHEFDRSKFYPPEYDSVKFKLLGEQQQVSNNNKREWTSIKTGDSIILKENKSNSPISTVFYTGGVNTASAWLPRPPQGEETQQEIIAVAIDCSSLDQTRSYKQCHKGEACVQFWIFDHGQENTALVVGPSSSSKNSAKPKISLGYIMAHNYGTIFDMIWCPLGASWESRLILEDSTILGRVGLLALACGDGQIRIISVPHTKDLIRVGKKRNANESIIDITPFYKVQPIATLVHPGAGQSTDSQPVVCRTIDWSLELNQRYLAAGYTNGTVALFDIQNTSPIIYCESASCHIHQPLKSCIAHGAPVTGIAISALGDSARANQSNGGLDRVLIASGSTDRLLKIWHVVYDNCIDSERAPITRILWDYRFRGIITACDTAFTSFNNRVSYRYPSVDGHQNVTISVHHSIVWGLANSIITNAIATSDGAGEVFVMPQTFNRSSHKRDRTLLSIHSLYTLLPKPLELASCGERTNVLEAINKSANLSPSLYTNARLPDLINVRNYDDDIENVNDNDQDGDHRANVSFSAAERTIANKPTKFLLPLDHKPVETYSRFKTSYGLGFLDYNTSTNNASKPKFIPESCARAGNLQNIYCDRACDYPFSSINNVIWSPNVKSYSYLLSTAHIGLCRLDRVEVVEQIYKHFVDSMLL